MTDQIWDPLRKKNVALTPEERVRQWFIGVLNESMKVPMQMMMSEAALELGSKKFRADIVVYDRSIRPVMIVECKRPEVELTQEVMEQAIRYNMVLNVNYIVITNGKKTYICGKENGGYKFMEDYPLYNEFSVCR